MVQRAFLCSPAGMQLLQNRLYNGTVIRGAAVRGTVVRGAAASVQANLVTIVPPAIKMPQKIAPKSQNVKKLRVETDNERDNREYSEWTKRSGRKPRLMPRSMLARCVDV